jgi:hypothetical protein
MKLLLAIILTLLPLITPAQAWHRHHHSHAAAAHHVPLPQPRPAAAPAHQALPTLRIGAIADRPSTSPWRMDEAFSRAAWPAGAWPDVAWKEASR